MEKKEYYKKWCEENKDKLKGYAREYYKKNREKVLEQAKNWIGNNPDKVKISKKKYYDSKKDELKEYYKSRRQESPFIECECGHKYRALDKKAHYKTDKHKKGMIPDIK